MGLSNMAKEGTTGKLRGKALSYKGFNAGLPDRWEQTGQPWKNRPVSLKAPSELKAYVIVITFQPCGFGDFSSGRASLWWILLAMN